MSTWRLFCTINSTFMTIIWHFYGYFRGISGLGQYLEWSNVERPIFRNFKMSNIKITKDELLDFKFSFFFICLFFKFFRTFQIYDNFPNWKFLEFRWVSNCQTLKTRWLGRAQHLEQSNVERTIFRNFKMSNIKITKDELLDFKFSIFFYLFICWIYSNVPNIW